MRQLCLITMLVATVWLTGGCSAPGRAAPGTDTTRTTPPMGWNSWDSGIPLTENTVHEVIDAMVASGMRDAGYRYVNLDAGWAAADRDAAGHLRADPEKFPHGIAALAEYAHRRGMYLGLYSSPYNQTCGQTSGNAALGHEDADARTFAAWGVDLLKYDWCRDDADLAEQVRVFTRMRDALRASGRWIIYSINPNSSGNPGAAHDYDWSKVADMTRNGSDLIPLWHNPLPEERFGTFDTRGFIGVTDEVDAAQALAARSRPGYWNDPDMLVVGMQFAEFLGAHPGMIPAVALGGLLSHDQLQRLGVSLHLPADLIDRLRQPEVSLTVDEQRAHFSLWAMLAAPLIVGADVRHMSESTRSILTNPDVVAVDQDPLVAAARPVAHDQRILVKPLTGGRVAVTMLNTDERPASIATTAHALGLPQNRCYTVRDLWTHHRGSTDAAVTATDIPPHGVAMFEVAAGC